MKNIKTKLKIWSLTVLIVLIATFGLAAVQNKIIGVSAQIDPIEFIGPDADFGLVFPQEILEKKFHVLAALEYPDPISYALITQVKPRPDFVEEVGWPEASEYCIAYPLDYEKCYPLLCPYLDSLSRETEGDTQDSATLKEPSTDQVDYWKVVLDTPPIKGNVGQDFDGVPVDSAGEYGCDIRLVLLESVSPSLPPEGGGGAGGGGGGYTPPGAPAISEQEIEETGETFVIITWLTDYPATSRVIYDTVPHPILSSPPNYGYAFSTLEQDLVPRVSSHAVRIDGLTPGTTYYYRTISRASPEQISGEYSFTTLGERVEEKIEEKIEEIPPGEEIPPEEVVLAPTAEEGITLPPEEEVIPPEEEVIPSEEVVLPEEVIPPKEGIVIVPPEEKVPEKRISLFAGIADILSLGSGSVAITIIVLLAVGTAIFFGVSYFKRKRKK